MSTFVITKVPPHYTVLPPLEILLTIQGLCEKHINLALRNFLLGKYWKSHKSVIEALLQNGASVDSEDSDANTALFWAAAKGATCAIVKLIESGAEMQQFNTQGFTPLHAGN